MRLVYLALGWVCGIVLAAGNDYPPEGWARAWLALCLASLAAAWLLRDWLRWPALALLAMTLGGLRLSLAPDGSELARFNDLGGVSIEGVVSAAPAFRDEGMRLRVNADTLIRSGERSQVSGAVLVESAPDRTILPGDRVLATGILRQPGEHERSSWSDYLARRGIYSVMQDATLLQLAGGHRHDLTAALYALNQRAGQLITQHLPHPQAALLKGILLGDESGLSPAMRQAFSDSGATHVIAISGFNMIVLGGAVMALLRRTRLSPGRAAVIGILVILLYTLFVGAGASVLRAALMSCLLVLAAALRRRVFTPASLACAVLLLSLENPTVLWDIGFQLSVFATLGIMTFTAPLQAGLQRALERTTSPAFSRRAVAVLAEPLVVSLAAWSATLPLILRYFERLSLVSLPVNLFIIPAQAPLLILGLLATALAFVAPLPAQLLYWLDLLPLTWTTTIVSAAASLPGAAGDLHVDPGLVAAIYVVMITAMVAGAARYRWAAGFGAWLVRHAGGAAALLTAAGLALLVGAVRLGQADGMLHLWLLDVGHSNAVLMQGPRGEQILIDAGHAPSRLLGALGERLPFYDRRIELLLLSRPDPAAHDTLAALTERHDIGLLVHNGQRGLPSGLEAAADRTIALRAGHVVDLGDGFRLEILHPPASPSGEVRQAGSSALVVRVRYGSISFLLPASLDRSGQQVMLDGDVSPAATVMQLPQHGGAGSLEHDFLRAVSPRLTIVHVDPRDSRNRRGDPHPDTLAMLTETTLLRSDRTGVLHLWSDGERLWRDELPSAGSASQVRRGAG